MTLATILKSTTERLRVNVAKMRIVQSAEADFSNKTRNNTTEITLTFELCFDASFFRPCSSFDTSKQNSKQAARWGWFLYEHGPMRDTLKTNTSKQSLVLTNNTDQKSPPNGTKTLIDHISDWSQQWTIIWRMADYLPNFSKFVKMWCVLVITEMMSLVCCPLLSQRSSLGCHVQTAELFTRPLTCLPFDKEIKSLCIDWLCFLGKYGYPQDLCRG